MTISVLCIDHEGGHGGSSKSLRIALQYMNRSHYDITVWCRLNSPFLLRYYNDMGISCRVCPDIPTLSFVEDWKRNIFMAVMCIYKVVRGWEFLRFLMTASKKTDLIHLNNENLFLLAPIIRWCCTARISMHVRTTRRDNFFTRLQSRIILRYCDQIIFITENEQKAFERHCGQCVGKVIYNPVETAEKTEIAAHTNEFRIVSLSNHDYDRGTDRLIEIAKILKKHNVPGIKFIFAGDSEVKSRFVLMSRSKRVTSLIAYAAEEGVSDYFEFIGHVDSVDAVLLQSDAVIKMSRDMAPWGRDLLEGMAFGKVPITIGSYQVFVQEHETGLIFAEYDAEIAADEITKLATDKVRIARFSVNGRERIRALCDPREQGEKMSFVWRKCFSMP